MSSRQGPLPYLEFCGVEIANAARTVSYLRSGLGDTAQGGWELGDGEICGVLTRLDGDEVTFLTPALDPAPWFDPDEPGSETFLGLFMLGIDGYESMIQRSVTPRIGYFGGGSLGSQNRLPRTWKFSAAMISADGAGAEFGLRWLLGALQSNNCEECSGCDLIVRLLCPPSDGSNDGLGEWISYDVALIDGPREVDKFAPGDIDTAGTLIGCRDVVTVEWTMVAANAWLYRRPAFLSTRTYTQEIDCDESPPSSLTITNVEPLTGASVGDPITITGTGFDQPLNNVNDVSFVGGGGADWTVDSDTQITADAPDCTGNDTEGGRIVVGTLLGDLADYRGFECPGGTGPVVESFAPTSAPPGDDVVITGINFTGATDVTVAGVPAASFVVDSDTQITAVAGACFGFIFPISVTTPVGTAISQDNFECA